MSVSQELFNWVLEIPNTLSKFGTWLTSPLAEPYITLSPLALLGVGGVGVIISIIVFHVVRLFVGG